MIEKGTCPHCGESVAVAFDENGTGITSTCPECGGALWSPADGQDGVWYTSSDQMPEHHKCSLCGAPTEFKVGSTVADWYLCERCAGTPEADAAGYTHV